MIAMPMTCRALLLPLCLMLTTAAVGQTPTPDPWLQMQRELEARRIQVERDHAEATAKLREAITNLRAVRNASCQRGDSVDCMLANLNGMELILLEIEGWYERAEGRAQSSKQKDQFRKIKEMADDLRGKVDDLEDEIQAGEKVR